MPFAHDILTFIVGALKSPFRSTKARVHPTANEPLFFTLLPLDLQVHVLQVWVDEAYDDSHPDKLTFNYDFARATLTAMDMACCNRALREPFLHLVRFMGTRTANSPVITIGFWTDFDEQTDDSIVYAAVYSHVQWMVNKSISCDSVYLPKHPAALRALEKLAEDGVQVPSVTKAHHVSLPADYEGVFRLFPNCASFRYYMYPDHDEDGNRREKGIGEMISDLNTFIRKFPQVQLNDLTVWFPSADATQAFPGIVPHVESYAETLTELELCATDDASTRSSASTDDLINAVCECKSLNRFKSYQHPIHTAHVLQLLNSCHLLVDLAVTKSGKDTIVLGDILWFTRSGSALKSLALALAGDYGDDETLVDDDDAILQHLERLMANHPSDCWDTVSVGGFFTKCRTENMLRLAFSNKNAKLLCDKTDKIVSAIQTHAFTTEFVIVDDFRIPCTPTLLALADFYEALNQPIEVIFFIKLLDISEVSRIFQMVSTLHIRIEYGRANDDATLLVIVRLFPHLVDVDLSWSYVEDQITDRGMCALFAGCPHLKHAKFGNVPRVTKRSLQAILANKLQLQVLEFEQAAITPKDIENFSKLALQQQFLPIPTIVVTISSRSRWLDSAAALFNGRI